MDSTAPREQIVPPTVELIDSPPGASQSFACVAPQEVRMRRPPIALMLLGLAAVGCSSGSSGKPGTGGTGGAGGSAGGGAGGAAATRAGGKAAAAPPQA